MSIPGDSMSKALTWAYQIAVSGGPGFESAEELAASYADVSGDTRSRAQRLVRWQVAKAGATGFVTGLPGLAFLPVTVPANVGAILAIQLRMVAAIALLAGQDPRRDQVRVFCLLCLAGDAMTQIARNAGIHLSRKVTEQVIRQVSGKTLAEINKRVGFRLATKFGEKGVVNLGKAIPLVGGVVGATFDAVTTELVGRAAVKLFVDGPDDLAPVVAA